VVFLQRLLLCCCVFFGGGAINPFGFGISGVEVAVVGVVLCFAVFCHGIAHSSAAFCSAIFVPQHKFYVPWHYTFCHCAVFVPLFLCLSTVVCAMALHFLPQHSFCAARLFLCCGAAFVLQCHALCCDKCDWCHGIYALCHSIAQCAMPLCNVFFAAALCFMPWNFFVPWHCAVCCLCAMCRSTFCV